MGYSGEVASPESTKISIATHDGKFHADEVMAVSILLAIYPDAEVIRSRRPNDWKEATFVVDVGKLCDDRRFFDHHQVNGAGKRLNGVPYASAGLIWKSYGRQYLEHTLAKIGAISSDLDWFWREIDIQLIQGIDAIDCGEAYIACILRDSEPKKYLKIANISTIIGGFNPVPFMDRRKDSDEHFVRAVAFASEQLFLLVRTLYSEHISSAVIEKSFKQQNEPEILFLDRPYNWKSIFRHNRRYHSVKFVIVEFSDDNRYRVYPADRRKHSPFLFHKDWRGRIGRDLAERSGIESADNCHTSGILFVTKTKEDAYKVAQTQLDHVRQR